jgi:hypothetical protein
MCQATEATGSLSIEPHADAGIRGWLAGLGPAVPAQKVAAFDTRTQGPSLLTGRASKAIIAQLREAGFDPVSEPESFKVTSAPELGPGELERARLWGESLAAKGLICNLKPGAQGAIRPCIASGPHEVPG